MCIIVSNIAKIGLPTSGTPRARENDSYTSNNLFHDLFSFAVDPSFLPTVMSSPSAISFSGKTARWCPYPISADTTQAERVFNRLAGRFLDFIVHKDTQYFVGRLSVLPDDKLKR
jgi:hypothetical protein